MHELCWAAFDILSTLFFPVFLFSLSGQWRLGGVSLIVTYGCQPTSDENIRKEVQYIGSEYSFEIEDTLLGEGSDISMVEVRPCLVKEFSGDNLSLLSENLLQPTSTASNCEGISNEESMREYADLKFSLLLYDALLVFAGSSVASVSAGENAATGFLSGGIVGFLYLLLIQRSVDGLAATPASTSVDETGKVAHIFRRFLGPSVSRIALAFAFVLVAVKYGSRDFTMMFTAEELMFGMLGFLACKVAVVLAVFKPIPMEMVLEENK